MSMMMVLLLSGGFAFAQQSGRERRIAAEKKAALERSRSMGGFRSGNDVKDDKEAPKAATQQPGGLEEHTPSNQPDPNDDSGSKGNKDQSGATSSGNNAASTESGKAANSNAPVVLQRTTSESGSPSVLSKDNGRGRDGTNNVQRATYNMAGAEVPANMNLSRKNRSEKNMNTGTRIMKQEEQPQNAVSRQTPRSNDQQADPQRADEQAKNKSDDKKKNKSPKKNRRNKDRDSG